MKKLLTIFAILAAVVLISSCQKELPDAIKNVDVNKGDKTPSSTPDDPTPSSTIDDPTPTPTDPTQQGDIPSEEDNPWPGY